ncbi:MAG: DUF1015 domain-containing protein [Nitrospirota bacterium]
MARILPFKGLLYNPDKVSGNEVIAPPYDVISPDYKEALYRKSPYNIVRIDFGKELPGDNESVNRYSRSRDLLAQWEQEGVLSRDSEPAFYAYEADYELRGKRKRLRGFLGLVKLEELGKGVYPHEATHAKPKEDRLNLMRWCHANISPIYALYNSPEHGTAALLEEAAAGRPYFSAEDLDGAEHRLYRIADPAKIELITRELCDKHIFIADGHHRYEVALEFKREMDRREQSASPGERSAEASRPWDYVLMFLANMADEGVSILPTHRMVKGIADKSAVLEKLAPDFAVSRAPLDADIAGLLSGESGHAFGLYLDTEQQLYVLNYREDHLQDVPPALRELDVVILHELILKRDLGITEVAFEMDAKEALRRVRNGDFDGVFFLNPTGVGDVERVALSNLRMPPKSTYFYPKLLTGMVIYRF